jgi:hypothetical protein
MLATLRYSAAEEELKFVFQYNTQAERTPLFTQDPRFNITGNDFKEDPNELTLVGLRNAFDQGVSFREVYLEYYNGFLSLHYDPTEFFIRAYPDHPSIMSAYAFLLGVDPEEIEGIGLITDTNSKKILKDAHVDDARVALMLDKPKGWSNTGYIHAGNTDDFFFKDIVASYPGLKNDFDKNIQDASQEFRKEEGNKLFYKISSLTGIPFSDLTFQNLAKYLDDYMSSFSNGKEVTPFEFDLDTLSMVSTYYKYLIKNGLLRDPALNRVIAHPFLFSLLREIQFKSQDKSELEKWVGPCVSSKVSLGFGNRLTYLAVIHALQIDDDAVYSPGWGDQLTFELFQEDEEWFVRILNNNDIVPLNSENGSIPLNDFKDFICSKLYYGNMEEVEAGREDYHKYVDVDAGK